ncbi:MAG: hypothetical protein AB1374_09710 [Bacillota bacterium]
MESNVDWTDAVFAVQMVVRNQREIYSYDRDSEKIEGIVCVEPQKYQSAVQ